MNIFTQDWTLPEPPASAYSDSLISNARSFSDTAMVVVGRVGGENIDIPREIAGTGVTYINNSESYEDFPAGPNYLSLSQTEHDLLEMVVTNFDPPYTNGGIEKSTANLVAYGKTGMLKSGASETVTLTLKMEDMDAFHRQDTDHGL